MIARDVEGGARLVVRVHAKTSTETVEFLDGVVVVKVAAPPKEGKANARVIEVVAAFFALPRRQVELVRGHTARDKDLRLTGVSAAAIATRFAV